MIEGTIHPTGKTDDSQKGRQRSPNTVGMIYKVEGNGYHNTHLNHRIQEGDYLLCLEHTGDCHYTWALLIESSGNDWTRYFNIEKVYSAYAVNEECAILPEPADDATLLSAVIAMSCGGRSGILIDRPEAEVAELRNVPCPFCQQTKPE